MRKVNETNCLPSISPRVYEFALHCLSVQLPVVVNLDGLLSILTIDKHNLSNSLYKNNRE